MTIKTDRQLIRSAARSTRYVLAQITAPDAPERAGRIPVNVAIVLDRSGSMGGQKIALAREAAGRAVAMLRPADRFSIVVFDDQIDLVVESTPATAEAKRHALQRLGEIDARGSTDLFGGWQRGADQVAAHLDATAVARCLLLTDGLANVGVTEPAQFAQFAAESKARGIFTSTLGVGADFDERLLQQVAQAGAGHFYFIEQAVQIPDLLTSELGEALEVVAREVALIVQVPDGVDVEPLQPFETHSAGHLVRAELGDLVSGQELEVVLKVVFPIGKDGDRVAARIGLTALDGVPGSEAKELVWTFAAHEANDGQRRDRIVDRAVARIYAARARHEALELNRGGEFDRARAVLERVARRIRSYAGGDAALEAIARDLLAEREVYAFHMDAIAMKQRHFVSHNVMASRTADGKARKRT